MDTAYWIASPRSLIDVHLVEPHTVLVTSPPCAEQISGRIWIFHSKEDPTQYSLASPIQELTGGSQVLIDLQSEGCRVHGDERVLYGRLTFSSLSTTE